MASQLKTRASGRTENAGLKSVLLSGERANYNRHSEGLQAVSAPIRRVVSRLERQFSLSPSHARVVAELAFPMVARYD